MGLIERCSVKPSQLAVLLQVDILFRNTNGQPSEYVIANA